MLKTGYRLGCRKMLDTRLAGSKRLCMAGQEWRRTPGLLPMDRPLLQRPTSRKTRPDHARPESRLRTIRLQAGANPWKFDSIGIRRRAAHDTHIRFISSAAELALKPRRGTLSRTIGACPSGRGIVRIETCATPARDIHRPIFGFASIDSV
jgi:hypothetical protein